MNRHLHLCGCCGIFTRCAQDADRCDELTPYVCQHCLDDQLADWYRAQGEPINDPIQPTLTPTGDDTP